MSIVASQYNQHQTHRELSRGAPPVLSVAPTEYPCTVDEAKLAARISGSDEDSLILEYIAAAVEAVQLDAEIALCTQTRVQYLDAFPSPTADAVPDAIDAVRDGAIELRMPPVSSVSSLTYYDLDGTQQTLSSTLYQTDLTSRPGLILPAYGQVWPGARSQLHSVAVTFVCGYGAATSVPLIAKQALYLRVAASYRDREMEGAEEDRYWTLIDKLRWRKF